MNQYYENPNMPGGNFDYEEDEIDIMKYVALLLKNWKFVFKAGCIGVAVGLVFALSVVKDYTCSATLAPEVTIKSGSSSLSSLASLAGINLSSMNSADALNPDLYPQIVNSIPFKVQLLDTHVVFAKGEPEEQEMPLYTYLDDYTKGPWYSAVLAFPMKALGWVLNLIKGGDEEEEGDYVAGSIDPENLTNSQSAIVKALSESISITVDKKTSLISVSAKAGDPNVAKQLCDNLISRLEEYVVAYRTEKSRKDVEYYTMLNEEARADYYAAQQKYARYMDANQGVVRNSFMVESQRLQNESNLAFQLYNSIAQQLQLAQAKIQMETPVCVIIEPTTVPLRGEPSRAKILVIWAFLIAAGAAAWVMFKDDLFALLEKLKNEESSEEK